MKYDLSLEIYVFDNVEYSSKTDKILENNS